jgi:hypothetical protein
VVAAIRSKTRRSQAAVPPTNLINVLSTNAQNINGPTWNRRIGNGILDARAASAVLPPRPSYAQARRDTAVIPAAQNLNSGIFPNGSGVGLVSKSATTKQNGMKTMSSRAPASAS